MSKKKNPTKKERIARMLNDRMINDKILEKRLLMYLLAQVRDAKQEGFNNGYSFAMGHVHLND